MAMAGADPFAIMKAMGHTDIKTTQRYVTVTRGHLEAIMGKVEGVFSDKSLTAFQGKVVTIGKKRGGKTPA